MKMKKPKEKEKYKHLSEASDEEMHEAFKMAGLWITSTMEDRTDSGAFSEANLGVPAVEYYSVRAYNTLKSPDCRWHWKKGTKLSTLMINVVKSDMAHTLRDYFNNGKPDVLPISSLIHEEDDEGNNDANSLLEIDSELQNTSFQVQSDLELLEELEAKELQRDRGYKIACAVAKGDPQLERYVELAFELSDYRAISKRMKTTKAHVLELEAELLAKIKVTFQK